MIRLLVIDDSAVDRKVFEKLMYKDRHKTDEEHDWLKDVILDFVETAPVHMESYRHYDGVVLDMMLRGENGIDLAWRIHKYEWRLPIMLMTGNSPEQIPLEAHDFIDYVAFKNWLGPDLRAYEDLFGAMRCLVRQCARMKDMFLIGKSDPALHQLHLGQIALLSQPDPMP